MARRVMGGDVKHKVRSAGSKRDLRDDAEGGEAMALGAVGVAACHRPPSARGQDVQEAP